MSIGRPGLNRCKCDGLSVKRNGKRCTKGEEGDNAGAFYVIMIITMMTIITIITYSNNDD